MHLAGYFFNLAAYHGHHLDAVTSYVRCGADISRTGNLENIEYSAEDDVQFTVLTTASCRISSTPTRLHGLDALRGIAAVFVVLLHAGIPYMTTPLSYLLWPARDAHPCPVVDGLTWCTECFLMPLFFVLAGFFSQGILISRGERKFMAGRTHRLMVTQFFAGPLVMLPCLWIWSLGWIADGLFVPKNVMNWGMPPELESELYGFGHFWFLNYLYTYCLILCGASWLTKRFGGAVAAATGSQSPGFLAIDRLMVSVWKPLLPAIPCAIVLFYDPRIVLGFYQTFIPVLSKLVYYAIYFFVGVALYRHRAALHLHARFGKSYLAIAGLLFAAALPMIHEHQASGLTGGRLALMSGLLALFAWYTTFGLLAVSLVTKHGENGFLRYLAEASFWVYIVHLPFVGLTHVAIAQVPVPTIAKFLLAGMIPLSISLMTYHVFVREKWLGRFLDGRSRPVNPVTNILAATDLHRPVKGPHFAISATIKTRGGV
ncbi:MAG: acyltransferase family protein [Schlesneria sp.]